MEKNGTARTEVPPKKPPRTLTFPASWTEPEETVTLRKDRVDARTIPTPDDEPQFQKLPTEGAKRTVPAALPIFRHLPTARDDDYYTMRFPSKLIVVCISPRDTIGISKDRQLLIKFFVRIGFSINKDVTIKQCTSWRQVKEFMVLMSVNDYSDCSCLICCVLCRNEPRIYDELEQIWDPFCSSHCKSLVGKPKIFVIQACRELIKMRTDVLDNDKKFTTKLPKFSDLLVILPVLANMVGEIEENEGDPSKFIEALCESLDSLRKNEGDIMDMIRIHDSILQDKTDKCRQNEQMLQVTSTLSHRVPIFPSFLLIREYITEVQISSSVFTPIKKALLNLLCGYNRNDNNE